MGQYKITIGKEFNVEAVDVTDAEVLVAAANAAGRLEDANVRRLLAPSIAGFIMLALAVSAVIGYIDGTYDEIGATWNAAAFPLGYILATYFAKDSP